jgi:predicted nuclease with TOPRIM domain
MKYENTKSLTDLIDKIVLSESEELAKKIKSLEESNTRLRNDIIEKNKEISQYRDRNEELSRHIEIIKKYEQDT